MPADRACLFCQQPLLKRSKEHTIPAWLQRHLRSGDTVIEPAHLNLESLPEGERYTIVSQRRLDLDSLVAGLVCERCNTGWMSDIEIATQPLLEQIMQSKRYVWDLTEEDRSLLARWAAKTAFVLNRSSNYHVLVPDEHFAMLRTSGDLPDRVIVVAQQHRSNKPFYWMQTRGWSVEGLEDEAEESLRPLIQQSYKVVLQFGDLIVMVAWWGHPGWVYIYEKGIHVPMRPIRGPVAFRESGQGFPWNDSVDAVVSFALLLGTKKSAG